MSDPVFILLKEGIGWIQEKHLWDVLGAVTKNYLRPGDESKPEDTRRFSKGLEEVILDNFVLKKEKANKKEKSLSFPSLFELRGKSEELRELNLQGKRVIVKRLRQQSKFWAAMTSAEPEVEIAVKEWITEKKNILGHPCGKAFWITGVLLCQDVHIAASDKDVSELLGRGEVPIGTLANLAANAAVGSPLPMIDLSALPNIVGERSTLTQDSQCFAAEAEGTYIFGLQLQQVVLSGKKGAEKLSRKDADVKVAKGRQLDDPVKDGYGEFPVLEVAAMDEDAWDWISN